MDKKLFKKELKSRVNRRDDNVTTYSSTKEQQGLEEKRLREQWDDWERLFNERK